MGWRVIHVTESERITLFLDNIKIDKKNDYITIPLRDIHSLILDNYRMVVSVQLLSKCCEYNINVIFCGIDSNPKGMLLAYTGHHLSSKILKDQIEWDDVTKGVVQQQIVKQKILNQYSILKKVGIEEREKLIKYHDSVENYDLTNREGHAAKVYFKLLFGKSFIRFEEDVINAGLNYGYSILRSQINKTVVAKGLNASLGVFHKNPYNPFNLSDDLIEPFRPIVDLWVYMNLLKATEFTKKDRESLIMLTTTKVMVDQKQQTIFNAMKICVDSLINVFEGESTLLKLPTL
jgi:CRISPR-associated protein Cas1